MPGRDVFDSAIVGRRAIVALGALYVSFALGLGYVEVTQGTPLSNAVFLAAFVGSPGGILLYGGYQLPQTDIHPKFYGTITCWCVIAIGAMTSLLTLYYLQPAASISNPARGVLVITAFVLVPAFVGGRNDAWAKTRAFEHERTLDLFRKVEQIADVGGWEIDPTTEEVFFTKHIFDLLGMDATEEPPRAEILDLFHEDDRPIVADAVENAFTAGDPFDIEVRFYTDTGEIRWVRLQGVPEVVDDEVVSLRGAVQDITERKEREDELQQIRHRMELSLDATDASVWDWDVEEDEATFYPSEESLYGTQVDSFEDFVEVVHPDDRELVRQGIENTLETGESKYEEIRIIRDGEVRWLQSFGQYVQDGDDSPRIIGVVRDITTQKTYERKLNESNERLEQFAYAASHDLQEPLRMISSYMQLIEQRYGDDLDEDGEEFIRFAVDGAERMQAMIDGLLNYSRIETQGDPFEPVELATVLEDVREDLQMKIEETDATITADSLPCVEGDPSQLRQVFQNLLKNAIEYSGDEPPRIHVSAQPSGTEWEIAVRDEGIGIDPDDHDRVFEVFERGNSRRKRNSIGIGLALCQRIIKRHGSDIVVDSQPGEGATFSFTLPAAENPDERVRRPTSG